MKPNATNSRKMAWFGAVSVTVIMLLSLWLLRSDSVPIIVAGLPIQGLLLTGHAYIANKRESEHERFSNETSEID